MTCHPKTGLHYINIFRPVDTFREARACYASTARRLEWTSVDEIVGWDPARPEWQNPEAMLVFWGDLPRGVPKRRRAALGFRFAESAGERTMLVRPQQIRLKWFVSIAGVPDIVFAGTPTARDFLAPYCRKTGLMPFGYDAETMGRPDWGAPKRYDIAFYGSDAGRREWILEAVARRFGKRFLRISAFGAERKALLDQSRAVLYVGHSEDRSLPGLRLWQAIAASAALVMEERDPWPAVAGRHVISIPTVGRDRIDVFLDDLEATLKRDLEPVARTAHEELALWTVDRCMEDFMVPETLGLRRA
jgi:hypothetical protein